MAPKSSRSQPGPDATTRMVRRPAPMQVFATAPLLSPAQLVASHESRLSYRIERLLGEGGFGQAYLARRIGSSSSIPDTVCIKASTRIDGWLREAYFGQLLADHPRAVRVYDVFPWASPGGPMLYCLALEYAPHGDLGGFLGRTTAGWSESTTRREIAGILHVLGKLHRGHLLHRDLTPMNVFVCDGERLKLGDFGIVRQQTNGRGITARTLNAMTAPSDILAGTVPKWQARDDVYQVGQLLGMLVRGTCASRVKTSDIRHLACSDQLKEIIHRCLGERRKRFESADELIAALRTKPAGLALGAVRTLRGVHLAFTGILTRPRREAAAAARRAGATVHDGPSSRTNVVVRGAPNVRQAAGPDGGLKLMEIKRLREKGHRIVLIDERRFWRLASATTPRPRPRTQA